MCMKKEFKYSKVIIIFIFSSLVFTQCFKSKSNVHLKNAVKLLNSGFYYEAGIELNNAAEILEQEVKEGKIKETQKEYFQFHFLMAMLYQKRKEYKKAIQEYERILDIDDKKGLGYIMLGKIYLEQKKYKKARELIKKALIYMPNYLPSYYSLGRINFLLGDYKKAIKYLKSIDKIKMVSAVHISQKQLNYINEAIKIESKILLGNIYILIKKGEQAKLEYLKISSESMKFNNDTGECSLCQKKRKYILIAESVLKNNMKGYMRAGQVYIKLFDYDMALRMFKIANAMAERLPDKDYLLYKMGECYYEMNKYTQALNKLQQVNNKWKFPKTKKLLGILYEREGELQKAYKYYKEYLEKNIYDKEIRKRYVELSRVLNVKNIDSLDYITIRNIAIYYSKIGRYEKAKKMFDKSLKIASEKKEYNRLGEIYNNIGVLEMKRNNYKKAKQYFLKGLKIDAINKNILYNLIKLNEKIGRYKDKNKYLKAIAKINKDKSVYKLEEGYNYLKMGKIDKAIKSWKELLNYREMDIKLRNRIEKIIEIIG